MILRIDTVLRYESWGDGCRISIYVCSSLLLRATNVHTYLEGLVGLVIRAIAEAAWRSLLARRHRTHASASLIQRRLVEHLLPRSLPISHWSLERRVDRCLWPIIQVWAHCAAPRVWLERVLLLLFHQLDFVIRQITLTQVLLRLHVQQVPLSQLITFVHFRNHGNALGHSNLFGAVSNERLVGLFLYLLLVLLHLLLFSFDFDIYAFFN